jgi:hypothetical protein
VFAYRGIAWQLAILLARARASPARSQRHAGAGSASGFVIGALAGLAIAVVTWLFLNDQ